MRRSDQRRAAVVALYQRDVTRGPVDELVGREATAFTRELVEGVEADRDELEQAAARLRSGEADPAGAGDLADRSAQLAAELGTELEREASGTGAQEKLL